MRVINIKQKVTNAMNYFYSYISPHIKEVSPGRRCTLLQETTTYLDSDSLWLLFQFQNLKHMRLCVWRKPKASNNILGSLYFRINNTTRTGK